MIAPEKPPNALPDELLPHPEAETEWWYYAGHFEAGSRSFAFHFAYFRRLCGKMKIAGLFPLSLLHRDIRFAHLSFSEFDSGTFHYAQRRIPGLGSLGAGESKSGLGLHIGPWSVKADGSSHRLRAGMRDISLDLSLAPRKPLVRHGNHTGEAHQHIDGVSAHASFPRVGLTGNLSLRGETLPAAGEAWIDREHRPFRLGSGFTGWDWFAIQFDDGGEFMIYHPCDHFGADSTPALVAWIDADGRDRRIDPSTITWEPRSWRTSPSSRIRYPVAWQLSVSQLSLDLHVEAMLGHHEVDARPSSGMFYSEAPVVAEGTRDGNRLTGRGFVEQVIPPPESMKGLYDFENENLGLRDWLFADISLPLRCRGTTVHESQSPNPGEAPPDPSRS